MDIQFGAHPAYFGLIGVNLTMVFVALAVLGMGLFFMIRRKESRLLEIALMLFLVSLAFQTFHGRLLQFVFPVTWPEQPLVDNNLTFNYVTANALAYVVAPVLLILILNRQISKGELGLKINNSRRTILYIVAGTIFVSVIFILTDRFFHQPWIMGYTLDGLILWIVLASIVSVFLQTFFFVGILFNRHLGKVNTLLVALIAFFAFQSYVAPNSLPWLACSVVTFSSKLVVTWKTRSIYGAAAMSIGTSLLEIAFQIL